MAIDMKEVIAEAAWTLLFDRKVKKLTVKDIVEECSITRQAFYYHFEDIPDLLKWMLDQSFEKILRECLEQEDAESGLRYFFSVAVSAKPYVEKGMQSNYGEEVEKALTEVIYSFFGQAVERMDMYRNYSPPDKQLILRYHCQAIMGILRGWTKEDTKNMDHIVHQVFLILEGKVSPG